MNPDKDIPWQYDEFQQVGKDYGDIVEVEKYDSRHSDFRDMEAEGLKVLHSIEVRDTDELIDLGCGTGTFAILASKQCRNVYAVDVSGAMLDYARTKAAEHERSNIEFHQAGFLTYRHEGPLVDTIVTTLAFHHLPDLWKGIALRRLCSMLRPGGQLFMRDVIIEETNAIENIAGFIDHLAKKGGENMKKDVEKHFKEEFSTYDWVMDGLLNRSGFSIRSKKIDGGVVGTYICLKK